MFLLYIMVKHLQTVYNGIYTNITHKYKHLQKSIAIYEMFLRIVVPYKENN